MIIANILMCYGEADGNANQAAWLYEEQFQRRPHANTIQRAVDKLRETGSFQQTREREVDPRFEQVTYFRLKLGYVYLCMKHGTGTRYCGTRS